MSTNAPNSSAGIFALWKLKMFNIAAVNTPAWKRTLFPRLVVALMITTVSTIAVAQQPAATVEDGRLLVQKHCAGCHAVDAKDNSKHSHAPAFRDVLKRYNASVLGEALAEGMLTGHPDMPEFIFEPSDAVAIIKYLDTLSEN